MTTTRSGAPWTIAALVGALTLTGCATAYYSTMEAFGVHKRDILVDRVQDARDTQEEAKETFSSALEQFASVVEFDGGELQSTYDRLNDAYESAQGEAASVREHVDDVEDVAEALFDEWEAELEQYSSAKLRRSSEQKLSETRRQYSQLIGAMRRAEESMTPVLEAFQDQVLYLKHNLNAQAIASLQDDLDSVEADVRALIREMEASIAEADEFIRSMGLS